jgi:hypothetical protein
MLDIHSLRGGCSVSRLHHVCKECCSCVRKGGHVLLFLRNNKTRGLISRLLYAVRIDVDDAVS